MSAFPSSAVGLPQALKYDLPPSLNDSARAYSVNVAPDGITSVTGGALAFGQYTANVPISAGTFTSQIVSFTLPSGMSDSVFMDPASTTLSFTLTYSIGTAFSGASGQVLNLIGSGSSFFDQLVLYSNNVPIETINQYGLLQNFLLANSVSASERNGGISIAMGADTNSVNGIELGFTGTAGTAFRYNFTIPLLSVIGASSDKFIPIGAINNMQLQMQTSALLPFCSVASTAPTAGAITGFTLSEFTLNMKYIDVGDMAGALLKQTLQDGKWFIKSQTYTNSAVTIPNGSSGAQQLLLQIRNTSVKSILHQFGVAQGALCPNGYYDAINPTLNIRQCQVGGNFYPNKSLNDLQRPSESYPYLIQALAQGGGITKSYGTAITKTMYQSCANAVPTGSDSYWATINNGVRGTVTNSDATDTSVLKYPNSFYCGYDLEKSSGILFQGVNTRAQPPFLNLNIASAVPSTVICQSWGLSDVILEIDTIAKQVKAYV